MNNHNFKVGDKVIITSDIVRLRRICLPLRFAGTVITIYDLLGATKNMIIFKDNNQTSWYIGACDCFPNTILGKLLYE
jgi:hypothetical protein